MAAPRHWAVGDAHPNVEPRSSTSAAFNADIGALNAFKDTIVITPVKVVFESVIAILTLVRSELMYDDAFVGLAEYCVRMCRVLKAVTEGKDVDSLSGSVKMAIGALEKSVRCIESEVGRQALRITDAQQRHPGPIGVHPTLRKTQIRKILEVFGSDLGLDDDLVSNKFELRDQKSTDKNFSASASLMTRQSGEHTPLILAGSSHALYPGEQALQRLISGTTSPNQRVALVETICWSRRATEMVGHLRGADAQIFIDAADEASESPDLASRVRKRCLKSLYNACTGHGLLPRSLQIHLDDNPEGVALYSGGFGDVWKREYRGQEVAVKVVRMYADSDLKKTTRRFCKEFITWKTLHHPNVLSLLGVIMSGTQFAMVSKWMPNGNIDQYVKARPDANRFELLGDVAKGLIYMHRQGMVHGDLKGANILIDDAGHACLADFGLLSITSDGTSHVSSSSIIHGGTYRWMSPELFYPESFGLKDSRPTKHSDCYALGMVIYEVLSGRMPFPRYNICAVVAKVSRGERPGRPRGAERKWFTDRVWRMLQGCWAPKRDHRPRIEDVLQCLEEASRFWVPIPPRKSKGSSMTNSSTPNSFNPATVGTTEDSGGFSPSRVAKPESAHLFDASVKTPEHDMEEAVVEVGGEFAARPLLGRVDPASPLSSPDSDACTFIPPLAGIFASAPIPDFQPIQEWPPPSVDENSPEMSPMVFTMQQPSSPHKSVAEHSPRTYQPSAPPKSSSTPTPGTRKQRRGRKSRPRGHAQPASPRQSDSLMRSWPVKSLALLSTIVKPPSSSHEYNSDTSTTGPAAPPKPIRMPIPGVSKRREIRKSPHSSLSRDYAQSTPLRKGDPSPRASPGESSDLLSTLVEPPSSSYGYDIPLQTLHRKSLALSSTYSEPPPSPPKYDSPSFTHNPTVPPKYIKAPTPATSKQRGGVRLRPRDIIWDYTQPTSLGRSSLPSPSPPVESLSLLSTTVEPPSSHHGYDADSSSSTSYFILSPMPFGSPPGSRTMLERGGREPHHYHLLDRPKFVTPRRRPPSRLQNRPAAFL